MPTEKKIDLMKSPSTERNNDKCIEQFTQRISDTLVKEDLEFFSQLIEQCQYEHNIPAIEIAAVLAWMVQGNKSMLLKPSVKQSTYRNTEKRKMRAVKADVGIDTALVTKLSIDVSLQNINQRAM